MLFEERLSRCGLWYDPARRRWASHGGNDREGCWGRRRAVRLMQREKPWSMTISAGSVEGHGGWAQNVIFCTIGASIYIAAYTQFGNGSRILKTLPISGAKHR